MKIKQIVSLFALFFISTALLDARIVVDPKNKSVDFETQDLAVGLGITNQALASQIMTKKQISLKQIPGITDINLGPLDSLLSKIIINNLSFQTQVGKGGIKTVVISGQTNLFNTTVDVTIRRTSNEGRSVLISVPANFQLSKISNIFKPFDFITLKSGAIAVATQGYQDINLEAIPDGVTVIGTFSAGGFLADFLNKVGIKGTQDLRLKSNVKPDQKRTRVEIDLPGTSLNMADIPIIKPIKLDPIQNVFKDITFSDLGIVLEEKQLGQTPTQGQQSAGREISVYIEATTTINQVSVGTRILKTPKGAALLVSFPPNFNLDKISSLLKPVNVTVSEGALVVAALGSGETSFNDPKWGEIQDGLSVVGSFKSDPNSIITKAFNVLRISGEKELILKGNFKAGKVSLSAGLPGTTINPFDVLKKLPGMSVVQKAFGAFSIRDPEVVFEAGQAAAAEPGAPAGKEQSIFVQGTASIKNIDIAIRIRIATTAGGPSASLYIGLPKGFKLSQLSSKFDPKIFDAMAFDTGWFIVSSQDYTDTDFEPNLEVKQGFNMRGTFTAGGGLAQLLSKIGVKDPTMTISGSISPKFDNVSLGVSLPADLIKINIGGQTLIQSGPAPISFSVIYLGPPAATPPQIVTTIKGGFTFNVPRVKVGNLNVQFDPVIIDGGLTLNATDQSIEVWGEVQKMKIPFLPDAKVGGGMTGGISAVGVLGIKNLGLKLDAQWKEKTLTVLINLATTAAGNNTLVDIDLPEGAKFRDALDIVSTIVKAGFVKQAGNKLPGILLDSGVNRARIYFAPVDMTLMGRIYKQGVFVDILGEFLDQCAEFDMIIDTQKTPPVLSAKGWFQELNPGNKDIFIITGKGVEKNPCKEGGQTAGPSFNFTLGSEDIAKATIDGEVKVPPLKTGGNVSIDVSPKGGTGTVGVDFLGQFKGNIDLGLDFSSKTAFLKNSKIAFRVDQKLLDTLSKEMKVAAEGLHTAEKAVKSVPNLKGAVNRAESKCKGKDSSTKGTGGLEEINPEYEPGKKLITGLQKIPFAQSEKIAFRYNYMGIPYNVARQVKSGIWEKGQKINGISYNGSGFVAMPVDLNSNFPPMYLYYLTGKNGSFYVYAIPDDETGQKPNLIAVQKVGVEEGLRPPKITSTAWDAKAKRLRLTDEGGKEIVYSCPALPRGPGQTTGSVEVTCSLVSDPRAILGIQAWDKIKLRNPKGTYLYIMDMGGKEVAQAPLPTLAGEITGYKLPSKETADSLILITKWGEIRYSKGLIKQEGDSLTLSNSYLVSNPQELGLKAARDAGMAIPPSITLTKKAISKTDTEITYQTTITDNTTTLFDKTEKEARKYAMQNFQVVGNFAVDANNNLVLSEKDGGTATFACKQELYKGKISTICRLVSSQGLKPYIIKVDAVLYEVGKDKVTVRPLMVKGPGRDEGKIFGERSDIGQRPRKPTEAYGRLLKVTADFGLDAAGKLVLTDTDGGIVTYQCAALTPGKPSTCTLVSKNTPDYVNVPQTVQYSVGALVRVTAPDRQIIASRKPKPTDVKTWGQVNRFSFDAKTNTLTVVDYQNSSLQYKCSPAGNALSCSITAKPVGVVNYPEQLQYELTSESTLKGYGVFDTALIRNVKTNAILKKQPLGNVSITSVVIGGSPTNRQLTAKTPVGDIAYTCEVDKKYKTLYSCTSKDKLWQFATPVLLVESRPPNISVLDALSMNQILLQPGSLAAWQAKEKKYEIGGTFNKSTNTLELVTEEGPGTYTCTKIRFGQPGRYDCQLTKGKGPSKVLLNTREKQVTLNPGEFPPKQIRNIKGT